MRRAVLTIRVSEMATFKQQPIRQRQTIGEQLRSARQSREIVRKDLAQKLRISDRYLDALERGRYNDMPSPVYIKNFLKRYAAALGMSWEKIEGQFLQEMNVYRRQGPAASVDKKKPQIKSQKPISSGSGAHQRKALEIPGLLKIGVVGIVVTVMVVYFAWEIIRLLSPPDLIISSPSADEIVITQKIIVEGMTEPEAIVEINSQGAPVDPQGHFAEEVFLHEGLNSIQITARSKQSRARGVIRNIYYNAEADSDRPELLPVSGTVPESVGVEDGAITK
ncbi:MAG: hypothetical protein COW24_03880 [Candidatus Kerfeldbacteria bacterium CG15_BIG_FIL_POST_REV_8_21_14_020_45_12]|uniref:HTH cro/C1-type domain-containing protein n=1 Tax=Candidatus Kerfeldbacteria bacterium CG15_BIG_FIL_POST_REV_8_21_14_020_45_12 TaxID=2014247 RepID=A0A2M7H369_9BACT|nr:MAG: hypothetical protein COW24_03880 [Candidatus Kerfeldbacteria bacterium CG15_BIG_FIL_POST_REV_8_21_14_020_45_12]PJA93548.1 MAG: hypothetical protein CO132_02865 [Candidatus Kerfeldbacteria bacterium CG_4_9_14_3_um_filter_45_8]